MLIQQNNSIDCAKEMIINLMKNNGLLSACSPGKSEEWIYKAGKFYSLEERIGIDFKQLKKRIRDLGDFRLYVLKDKVKLKVTPEKIVVFD